MVGRPTTKKKEDDALLKLRHSASHVMAQAVQEFFPGVKLAIGPSTEDGFYYDFDYEGTFSPDDFPKLEARMKEIIAQDHPFEQEEISKEEALEFFQKRGEMYKVELLQAIEDETVTLYRHDAFVDLCRGPHVRSTGGIKAFKLLSVAGAYWRGDEHNKMLQRIYGTAFPTQKELDEHLAILEEAKRRDHRRLGQELDLFSIHEEAGAGLVIYHPKGALLRSILEDFERREHLRRGYHLVIGPQILKLDLWKQSGHFDNYKDYMYFTEVEEQEYALKPMNCLAHMLIYQSRQRSYRDLPLRYFELGTVHRHERSGVLHGLLRVREFTQDDAHILCRPDQLHEEIRAILTFVKDVMAVFGFPYELEVSTRPEKSIGSNADWEMATQALLAVLDDEGLTYDVNEGEGAFYGPKIDVKLQDALGRRWQCATIQCDFTMPERFDLSYIGSDGEKHRPVMLHRVILGAMERFIGILIEHYGGAFPLWLAPVQAVILTVTDRNIPYGEGVYQRLSEEGIRVEQDFRNEKLGFKIREAQVQKIPYMLVIGDKEQETKTVSPRRRDGTDLKGMELETFLTLIDTERKIPEAHRTLKEVKEHREQARPC
jgi:threonyl-tRNA synthetase